MIISYQTAKPLVRRTASSANLVSFHNSKVVKSVFNGSGKPNRPMSNLLDQAIRKLPRSEDNGLISLFKLPSRVWRDSQMWGAICVELLNPMFPFKPLKEALAANRKLVGVISKGVTASLHASNLVSVRLTGHGAEVSIPVMSLNADTIKLLAIASTTADEASGFYAAGGLVTPMATSANTSTLKYPYLDRKLGTLFRSLGATLRISDNTGGVHRLFLDFVATRAQVEYMCNADFNDVRGIDLYGLIRTWGMGRTNPSVGLPRSTRSLSSIVSTLPAGGEPRTNEDGVLIDYDASVLYLPKEVNNVEVYDTSLTLGLMNEHDGSFSQFDGTNVRAMPVAQSVLLDWVNKKWSYTDTTGNLEVRDLSRAQPLNMTHIKGLLYSPLSTDLILSFCTKMSAWCHRVGGTPFSDVRSFVSNAVTLINLHPDYEGTTIKDIALYHIAELSSMHATPSPAWSARISEFSVYVDFCANVHKLVDDMKKDEDAYFRMPSNSVIGVSSTLAIAIVFDRWASRSDYVSEQDILRRAKYGTSTALDKDYKIPPLPYVSVEGTITPKMTKEQVAHAKSLARGLMPHQANVLNHLRDSPDHAILGVQAGGGKTMIIVSDILKEMKSGVKGPFLVLCPAHLVSQYVQEFTYATNGRVNMVAVTTYTLRRVGEQALHRMIESAPINTVVVADYNMAKGASKTLKVGYGTSSSQVYRVVEFLRQFNFQYAALDECHKLKNQNATQTRAIATLIADVPKKRLASGTFMDNSPSDIAGQFALLDPTVFGSVEKFNERFSESGTPGRITRMRPGAELEIMKTLKNHSCYVQVKRKEWAAVLPPRKEEMMFVELSTAQRDLYQAILETSVEELTKEAAKNETLARLLGIGKFSSMSSEDADAVMDEVDEDSHSEMTGGLDELLRPYLARLEQFLVAPARDPLGSALQGADRFSPKIAKLVEIYNRHVYEEEIPGKILVFTNQTASAEALYDGLPMDVKKRTIMYTAGRKDECGAEFSTDPNKVMMIGVSSSMDTGLNLQYCSRLVRCETVMSPGALEQGNSRIGRPNLKEKETRPATYYDWILVSNSIDVTKVAYLMTKKVRIASVEEASNPIFAELEVPELFSLSMENITVNNSRETLAPYLGENGMYRKFLELERADYQDFRDRHEHLVNANGKLAMVELSRSEDLPGSTILRRVPYVPGLNIYGEKELGLVRLDQYTKVEVKPEDEDEEGGDDSDITSDDDSDVMADDEDLTVADMSPANQRKADFMAKVKDVEVHTDVGEGFVKNVTLNRGRVRIALNSGEYIYRSILSTFVITKPQTSMGDVRGAIAKMAGSIPIDTPWEVKADEKPTVPSQVVLKKQKVSQHVDNTRSVALNLVVTNDMIGLEFSDLDDKSMAKTLRALKFVDTPQHAFAELKSAQVMNRLFKALLAKGYVIPKPQLLSVSSFYYNWKDMGTTKSTSMFGIGTAAQQKNFYAVTHKPNPDKMICTPYVSCEADRVYLCFATAGNKGNQHVVRNTQVTGVKFHPAAATLIRFFSSPLTAAAFIRSLMASGYTISNADVLHGDFTRLRKEIPKATDRTMEEFYNEKEQK